MEIVLIRHGATPANQEKRYLGVTDEPLSPQGEQELKERAVLGIYPRGERLIVSPMLRCRQTAEILYPGQRQELCPSLRECDFGSFEMKNYQELRDQPDYVAWLESGGTLPFPGGESREEFCARCRQGFLTALEQARRDGVDSLACVVHGGTIMAILDGFSHPHRDYFDWQLANGQGFRLYCENSWSVAPQLELVDRIL